MFEKLYTNLHNVLQLHKKLNTYQDILYINTLRNLGRLKFKEKKNNSALEYFKKALKLSKKQGFESMQKKLKNDIQKSKEPLND
mgnify:FL=1